MRRFKNILVVLDGITSLPAMLERVTGLAAANAANVTLVALAEARAGELRRLLSGFGGSEASDVEQKVRDSYLERLEEMASGVRASGIQVRTEVEQGTPSLELVRRVLREGHDLVVKNARREDDWPFLRGLDMQLLRKCPCPVMILNSSAARGPARIMAAVDAASGEPEHERLNRTVMDLATSLTRQDGAHLDVVSVWEVPEEWTLRHGRFHIPSHEVDAIVAREEASCANRLEALVREFESEAPTMRILHLKGRPAPTILRHVTSEGIGTLVMGTVARTGIAGFLIGNTAETILGQVTCSVLATKPEGFMSPVELTEDMAADPVS